MPDDQQHRRYRPVDLTSRRECRFPGCRRRSVRGHAFCAPHGVTDEAVAYYRELQQASAYFDLALQSIDPNQADRAEAFHRFRRRAQRGDFATLLDKPTRRLIEQAAALPDHQLEVGALRLALARAVSEETDPSRMGLTVARLAHAIARIATANPAPTHADKATSAALRLLDTALPPSASLPAPMIGRGVGGEGRPADTDAEGATAEPSASAPLASRRGTHAGGEWASVAPHPDPPSPVIGRPGQGRADEV